MLRILLNRLNPQAEEIIKEEHTGFRVERSTTEQIFNVRILCEKHQQSLYHVYVDFRKAFDRVWRAALRATMRLYNINDSLIRTIECLYNKATSAVYHDNIGEWFRATFGVRQGCLLSLALFNIFLERIIVDALEDHKGTVSIVRQDNYKLTFCWRHCRPSWTRAGAGQVGKSPWRGLHSIWHADQCREDPVDDK